MNRMLLCPPDFYGVRYSINPWMDPSQSVDHAQAVRQWEALKALLMDLGCGVEVMRPQPEWPDLVFTANAALIHRRRCVLSRFRHRERQGETRWYRQWLGGEGYEMTTLDGDVCFEGEGDALFCGKRLYCGHGFRTDPGAPAMLGQLLGCDVVGLRLVNPHYYHLDTCFCPLAEGLALWYPDAFDAGSQKKLRDAIPHLIEASADEAARFACNAIVLGREVVLPDGCPEVVQTLGGCGYLPRAVPMSEFIRAGGACKCLVLVLEHDRDGGAV
jgi:N-dimethylarginine dimethylaminohydrolase